MQFIDLLLVRCIFGGQIGHNNYEDFEHPTCRGNCKNQWNFRVALTGRIARKCLIPRAMPWAVESCPFGAYWYNIILNTPTRNSKLKKSTSPKATIAHSPLHAHHYTLIVARSLFYTHHCNRTYA